MNPRGFSRPALPTVQTEGWVNGWKAANLLIHGVTGEVKFVAMYQRYGSTDPLGKAEPYGIRAEAKCQFYRHKAPHKPCRLCGCTCGFYAADEQSRDDVLTFLRQDIDHGWSMVTDNLVILSVAFKGKMYQGPKEGTDTLIARAAFQEVTSVYVLQNCGSPDCFGKPVALGRFGKRPESKRLREYSYLRPLCAEHASSTSISLEQCSKRLGVPVDWHDPLTRVARNT